nr:hypothetical protein [Tanacetum cinerariifolium]
PEWSGHVTVVHRTKDLHTADYTQLCEFLKQYARQNVRNPAGFNDVIGNQVIQYAAQNPRVQNVGNPNGLMGVQGNGNLVAVRAERNAAGHNGNQIRCYNCRGVGHFARDCTARPRRRDAAYLQTQLLIAQKEEAGIQLQAEEYDLMAAAADFDEIEEVSANYILMANLQQASSSGTQTDSTFIYDSDGSAENLRKKKNLKKNKDDMEVDIEEDDKELELTYPYEEVDPLNPSPPASESKPEDVIEVKDTVESEDETAPASVHEVVEWLLFQNDCVVTRRCMHWSKKGIAKDDYYGKLILDLGNEMQSSVNEGMAAMENLVKMLESGDAAIAAERARHANAKNNARESGPVRGQDSVPAVCECTFTGYMKSNPSIFYGIEGAVKLRRWFVMKTKIRIFQGCYYSE